MHHASLQQQTCQADWQAVDNYCQKYILLWVISVVASIAGKPLPLLHLTPHDLVNMMCDWEEIPISVVARRIFIPDTHAHLPQVL